MSASLYIINIILAFAWTIVTGSFTLFNLTAGFLIGAFSLWLIREQSGSMFYFRKVWRILDLIRVFLWELVLSAVRVAVIVTRPNMNLSPGIIAYPLTVDRDVEITLLANLITLTPGTLSVDVSIDRKILYVHCIDVPDEEATIRDIRDGFERKIMEAFRS